jgi:hypothetical protein
MEITKEILSKMRGLKPLARYSSFIPIQVVSSAIIMVGLTAFVTGLFDLLLLSDQRNLRLPSWLFLVTLLGVPFMLGLIVHRLWEILVTPVASVLSWLINTLWQCHPKFSCLREPAYDFTPLGAFIMWFILWMLIPTFCGWFGFKLRGNN